MRQYIRNGLLEGPWIELMGWWWLQMAVNWRSRTQYNMEGNLPEDCIVAWNQFRDSESFRLHFSNCESILCAIHNFSNGPIRESFFEFSLRCRENWCNYKAFICRFYPITALIKFDLREKRSTAKWNCNLWLSPPQSLLCLLRPPESAISTVYSLFHPLDAIADDWPPLHSQSNSTGQLQSFVSIGRSGWASVTVKRQMRKI
jgi:hypothetical protein